MKWMFSSSWWILGTVAILLLVAPGAWAEQANQLERDQVCSNWLAQIVWQQGDWAGSTQPGIIDAVTIVEENRELGTCYTISPRGYVIVPVLKEMPPVTAYSDDGDLDIHVEEGLPAMIRGMLLLRVKAFIDAYGSPEIQPPTGTAVFGPGHREQWDRLLADKEQFEAELGKTVTALAEVGPLLTSSWHQNAPYNDLCPMGDGGRSVVGCVATASAMIMHYWQRPVSGIGSHSYTWDGDQSCGGDVGGGTLAANFSDTYDWGNMPDDCVGGCSAAESAALAELSYEVGVAYEMNYGRCGSGASTSNAQNVFPNFFGYDSAIDRENRGDHGAAGWFGIIKADINAGRPMQYRIPGHSIVCDGWRDTGGSDQYHINYGWGGTNTGWFAIDNIPGSPDPEDDEYLIRNIIPPANQAPVAVCKPYSAHPANEDCELVVTVVDIDGGSYDPDGAFDIASVCITAVDGNPVGCQESVTLGDGPGTYTLTLTITDNYNDSDSCTATVEVLNQEPVAVCVPSYVDEADEDCCIVVSVDDLDDGSYDPDGVGDVASLGITAVDGVPVGDLDEIELCEVGVYDVEISITDWCGGKDSCTVPVSVIDTTPPELTVSVDRDALWPPNHKMVDITTFVSATDNCDADPHIVLWDVTSNEPDDGLGDGNTKNDIVVIDDTHFQLRSERAGGGGGRVYTITYRAEDFSGNQTVESLTVSVPHDNDGFAFACTGFLPGGGGFVPGAKVFALVIPSAPETRSIALEGGPAMEPGTFDATQIDIDRIYVGNTAGVAKPLRSGRTDINRDGMPDLVLYCAVEEIEAVQTLGTTDEITLADGETITVTDGPIGLHYALDGNNYLASDIFELPIAELKDVVDEIGIESEVMLTGSGDRDLPGATRIVGARPNPFNPSTYIQFAVRSETLVTLTVYDFRGTLVRRLASRVYPAGKHEVLWDGRNESGGPVAAGVYMVSLSAGDVQSRIKVALIK